MAISAEAEGTVAVQVSPSDDGLCRIGWSTRAASLELGTDKFARSMWLNYLLLFVCVTVVFACMLTLRHGFGYGGTGKKSHNRQFDDYGGPFGLGDHIGCALDCNTNVQPPSLQQAGCVHYRIPG